MDVCAVLAFVQMIAVCDHELSEQLQEIRKILKRPTAQWTAINGVGQFQFPLSTREIGLKLNPSRICCTSQKT